MKTRRALLALLVAAASPAAAAEAQKAPAQPAPAAQGGGDSLQLYLTAADGKTTRAPLFADSSAPLAVATVGGEPITVAQLTRAIGGAHKGFSKETKAGQKDFLAVLNRMIDVRLLLLEARDMGLADLPEVKQALAGYEEQALREQLQARAVAGARPVPADVKRLYEEGAREWKARSVLVAKESDAKAIRAALAESKSFEAAAKKLVDEKKVTGNAAPEFLPSDKLLPQVLAALQKVKPGEVTPPVAVPGGHAILRLEEIRHRDDPALRAQAEQASLAEQQAKALKAYYAALVKKHVKVNDAVLSKVDFDAPKPGFAALKKDRRVVARIDGKPALTLGELATSVEAQFYHGAEQATKSKRAERVKLTSVDALISAKLVPMEARRLGLDRTQAYREQTADFADSLVFKLFLEKVVLPDVKVPEADLRAYYEQHKADYRFPAMYKLDSLAFRDAKTAQAALDKLRGGTDLKFLKQNADGQVADTERAVSFDGAVVASTAMPAELARQLAGAKKGDLRLYASERGQHHVVLVLDVTPASEKPFEAAQPAIQEKLFGERLTAAIHDWSGKLRKAHPVQVYLTKIGS